MGDLVTPARYLSDVVCLISHVTKFGSFYLGKPFDNIMILNAAVANIIVAILLGYRMDYDDLQFRRLMSLINENVRLAGMPMISVISPLLYISIHGVEVNCRKSIET